MSLPAPLAQDVTLSRFASLKRGGSLGHAYLIEGPAGSGKRTLARYIAALLLCAEGGQTPCGACSGCRKVLQGTHPDLLRLTLEEKAKNLKIEQVRDIQAILPYPPIEGRWKVVVLEQADLLTIEAQNALLKSLEEPPSFNLFLLLASSRTRLLPTVLSRCQHLSMVPLDRAVLARQVAERLPDVPAEARDEAARLSGGWLGEALEIAGDRRWSDVREAVRRALAGSMLDVFELSREWAKKADDFNGTARALRLVGDALREGLVQVGAPIERLEAWQRVHEIARYEAENNVNARLSLEVAVLAARRALGRTNEQAGKTRGR
jgi:DNA polymerase-3 subunit delta'